MVYNNVAISQFIFFNSLLRKGKRWRRGRSVQKIDKYRNIAMKNRQNTDTSFMIGYSRLFVVVFRDVCCIDLY